MPRQARRWRRDLDLLATLAMTAASTAIVWAILIGLGQDTRTGNTRPTPPTSRPKPVPGEAIGLDAPLLGSRSARVAIVEYSDFECPFSATYHERTYPALVKEYVEPGRVLLAFKHLPVEIRHPSAFRAAESAECASRQNGFWKMRDELFRAPRALHRKSLSSKAKLIGLNLDAFERCMQGEATGKVRQNLGEAEAYLIRATPSFLIGRITADGKLKAERHESGAVPFAYLRRILDGLLNSSETGTASR